MRMENESKLIEELQKISKVSFGPKLLENQIQIVFNEVKENISRS